MPFFVDTHCHLDAAEFAADRDTVRAQAAAVGVAHCVIPAVERANWDAVRQLAYRHGDSYALGIHPLYTARAADADLALLAQALEQHHRDPRLVAIGEIGLDFFANGLDPARQELFYRAQLQLARRFDLPVILHVRRSADKLLKGLRDIAVPGGIAHAFNGSLQQAQAFIALGFKLGFGGAVTYDRALQLRRLAAELPRIGPGAGNRRARHPPALALHPGRAARCRAAAGAQRAGRAAAHRRGGGGPARHACGGTGAQHLRKRLCGAAAPGRAGAKSLRYFWRVALVR